MERIKQALERAERDREYRGSAESTVEPIAPANTTAPGTGLDDLNIRFEKTRVVEVDAKHLEQHRVVMTPDGTPAANAYGLLASRLADQLQVNGWNTVGVVSPVGGDGKSVTALNLALRLVDSPKRSCLVVDLDFRRPRLAEYLGVTPDRGVEDVLTDRAHVSEVLFSPGVPRLSVMPVGQPVANPSGLIASAAATRLAAEVKARYANRIVLFDLPPILGTGDAVSFLRNLDAVLVVIGAGKTSESALQETLHTLADHNLLGCVLNGADEVINAY